VVGDIAAAAAAAGDADMPPRHWAGTLQSAAAIHRRRPLNATSPYLPLPSLDPPSSADISTSARHRTRGLRGQRANTEEGSQ